jgi:hypothetical protein
MSPSPEQKAIMDCQPDEIQKVLNLGDAEMDNAYGTYASDYPDMPIDKAAFTLILADAHNAFAAAINKGDLELNALKVAIKLLYDKMNNKNLPYINQMYKGNYDMLKKSGHPLSKIPSAHGIPSTPSIKRIEKWTEPNCAKYILNKRTGTEEQKTEHLTYFAYKSLSIDGSNPILVCVTSDKNKLIARNFTLKEDVWFWLTTSNPAGMSETSGRVKFTLV